MTNQVSLAIISDLHCTSSDVDKKKTYLHTSRLREPYQNHPVQAFHNLIKDKQLRADFVICPGDVADKVSLTGFNFGWTLLKELRAGLDATSIIASVGNHDVDSRRNLGFSTHNHVAKLIDGEYPNPISTANDQFWSKHFCVFKCENLLILNFNSAFSHETKEDAAFSRIEDSIIRQMRDKLRDFEDDSSLFRIAICHHHPHLYANIDAEYGDDDVIKRGDTFTKLLSEFGFHILVHGHKHVPRLDNLNDLPILCAGSFSSKENITDFKINNMAHILTLKNLTPDEPYLTIAGELETYEFSEGVGWFANNDPSSFFPKETGFGYDVAPAQLAKEISDWNKAQQKSSVKYSELVRVHPSVRWQPPNRRIQTKKILSRVYQLALAPIEGSEESILTSLY